SAADGSVFVVNVDDDHQADVFDPMHPQPTAIPLDIAHQERDSLPSRDKLPEKSVTDSTGKTTSVTDCNDAGPNPDDKVAGNMGPPRAVAPPQPVAPPAAISS